MVSFEDEKDDDFGWVDAVKQNMAKDVRYQRGGVHLMNNSELFLLDLFYQTKPEHLDWFTADPATRMQAKIVAPVLNRPTHIRIQHLSRTFEPTVNIRISELPYTEWLALRA